MKHVMILGTRGIPAQHGGFETFAEQLSLYLVNLGWQVTVYCQVSDSSEIKEEFWRGVRLVKIPVSISGPAATILYDMKATLHSLKNDSVILTLGYNTAVFGLFYRLFGKSNIINMDGIEWRRAKWGKVAKFWFYINEFIGCKIANHLVADNPFIKQHLLRHAHSDKIAMIPYCADGPDVLSLADISVFGLKNGCYALLIARPEPENSILEIVSSWSRSIRGIPLVVLGSYKDSSAYHKLVKDCSSAEVLFLGAIYDQDIVRALRINSLFYIHGHTVGGTNPSLVEAMSCANAVIAHDNPYNRWVVSDGALYFSNVDQCDAAISRLISDKSLVDELAQHTLTRFKQCFTKEIVLGQYAELLASF